MSKPMNSAVVIARLLGTEGFTDHTANEVEKYWRHKTGLTRRQEKSLEELDKAISAITANMSKGDRLVFGKFIGLHCKMSFDTGLKIGIQAFAQKNANVVEPEKTK